MSASSINLSIFPPLERLSARAAATETECVRRLLGALPHLAQMEEAIMTRAAELTQSLRNGPKQSGIESFLHEYSLSSDEGVAVMCLAEALLRIPDAKTADRLIHDRLSDGDWQRHLGNSESLFVNASSWGLMLTGKMLQLQDEPASLLPKLIGKMGEPVVRQALKTAMRHIGSQFVIGETIDDALAHGKEFEERGFRLSFDMLGEGARNAAQAQDYQQAYETAIAAIGKQAKGQPIFAAPSISIKLSGLHPRFQLSQQKRVMEELLPRLKRLALLAKDNGIAIAIDAEEQTRFDLTLAIFAALCSDKDLAGWPGLGFVVQAYQKRAFFAIDALAELARATNRIIPLRLVKGAYWDSEIKAAQIAGLPSYPVFTRKEHTDLSYLACADKMLQAGDCFFAQFATHNARSMASVMALAERYSIGKDGFEFQRLYGMGEALHAQILDHYASRIYAPVGEHKDLLAYLIRRLLENGANTSFVHLLLDQRTPMAELLADPIAQSMTHAGAPNPMIPLPMDMYGDRRNSSGIDFSNAAQLKQMENQLARFAANPWEASPLIAAHAKDTSWNAVLNPSNGESVGRVQNADSAELAAAMKAARMGFEEWRTLSVNDRCAFLEKAADLLEENRSEAMALIVREAGRSLPDALSELREAADFCRYYAAQARRLLAPQSLKGPTGESNALTLHPRGVFACISPWNFPLSIFVGQIVAALASGNAAIAKPAEQTPLTAAFAVRLLLEAGIPQRALQLLPGGGELGAALVNHAGIDGVVFTGSVETAKKINQSLAARFGPIIPFIAETGGQNAMVVDSSALLEQACDDIIASAFGSAGQRCSSLRVLFVQEEISAALIALLKGALGELAIGEPFELATDIGPVIDAEAKKNLLAHIEYMKKHGKLLVAGKAPLKGHFVAPHMFEIKQIGELTHEVFGPILHVIRFKANGLKEVADAINSTGFGLTFGIHSRIDETVSFFVERVRAGNLYVNRSMIGATVGVQPFGGEGLSGTGPKAGGPYYLLRFMSEKTLSVNTAAIGGNLKLLSD